MRSVICALLVSVLLASIVLVLGHSQVHATDAECVNSPIEGLQTECVDFWDNNGVPKPDTQYYKCNDFIACDKDPGTDKITKRCCVTPHTGVYGGTCLNLADVDRKSLGVGSFGLVDFRTRPCLWEDDQLSPSGKFAFIVSPKQENNPNPNPGDPPIIISEKTLTELYEENKTNQDFVPPTGNTKGGLPLFSENISVTIYPWFQNPRTISTTWYYELDNDPTSSTFNTRRYFIRDRNPLKDALAYHISGIRIGFHMPTAPFDVFSGGLDIGKVIGCKIENALKKPIGGLVSSMSETVSNSENLPDVNLLCSYGTPRFDDPSKLTFEPNGKLGGYVQSECHCADANSGPGTAAVLLCTRFIAGMEDVTAPWRLLIPVPDSRGVGATRFMGLLVGDISPTTGVDEFQAAVKQDVNGFFASNVEVGTWIRQIYYTIYRNLSIYPPDILIKRFFNTPPTHPDDVDINAFKNNYYVRQFISCISCAKFGGFPTALGCLPADKMDRFLAEGILGIGIGIAGAISVFCIIYGAIQFQISEGDSAKVQKAQKLITQCILGLLIILFSIFLLRFVGVNLLRIYGLS